MSNKQREKMKAKAASVRGGVGASADQVKKDAQKVADKGKKEANDLDAKMREQKRRDSKSEGWRSEVFDV